MRINNEPWTSRLKFSLRKIDSSSILFIIMEIAIFILLFKISNNYIFVIIIALSANLLWIIPMLRETYTYIYQIENDTYKETLKLYILYFNKSVEIVMKNPTIKIIEYGHAATSKTAPSIELRISLNNGKKTIRQYRICEWTKDENIKLLKEILKPYTDGYAPNQ